MPFVIMGGFLMSLVVLECIGSFTLYLTTDLGRDSFILPIPMWWVIEKFLSKKRACSLNCLLTSKIHRFPFDTRNPIGYLIASGLQFVHLAFESFFISNLVSLGVGAFLYALTAIKDLKNILRSIDAQCMQKKPMRERRQAMNQVREFVQMHSELKQLSLSPFI